jgi:hypothetical protein
MDKANGDMLNRVYIQYQYHIKRITRIQSSIHAHR